MKRNIDYWEEEPSDKEEVELSALEMSDLIEQRLNTSPKTKAAKQHLNRLIDEYNSKFGKTYRKIS